MFDGAIVTFDFPVAVQEFGLLRVQAERQDPAVRGQSVLRGQLHGRRHLRQPAVPVRRIRFEASDQSIIRATAIERNMFLNINIPITSFNRTSRQEGLHHFHFQNIWSPFRTTNY